LDASRGRSRRKKGDWFKEKNGGQESAAQFENERWCWGWGSQRSDSRSKRRGKNQGKGKWKNLLLSDEEISKKRAWKQVTGGLWKGSDGKEKDHRKRARPVNVKGRERKQSSKTSSRREGG